LNCSRCVICFVSLDLVIMSIFHLTIAYASSIHNNVDCLWLKFWYSLGIYSRRCFLPSTYFNFFRFNFCI
jgi:hypothetical protein